MVRLWPLYELHDVALGSMNDHFLKRNALKLINPGIVVIDDARDIVVNFVVSNFHNPPEIRNHRSRVVTE